MTPNQIKSELILRGIGQRDIAADLDVKSCAVSGVINRFWKSHRVAAEIARRIGKPIGVVFPEMVGSTRRPRRR